MALGWLARRGLARRTHDQSPQSKKKFAPRLEQLEDRLVPVTAVTDLSQGVTPQQLVQSLVGVGVQVANVTYTGANVAAGRFTGGQNTIGFAQGVILSTGLAGGVVGAAGTNASTNNGTAGDADLAAIVTPNTTFDAAVLEFDFVPEGDLLTFQYVFGSEEYPEFVNAGVNDVFAFFLNGQNIALIPGTTTPVSIDTVNANVNSQFYVDNTGGAFAIVLDAFTKVLTIKAKVNAGQSNHIKLAISDAGDGIFDSDVFIKAGSFSAAKAPIIKVFNPLRYTFNPRTGVYRGVMTLVNIGNEAQPGPVFVLFRKLPRGVSVVNASGENSGGRPYVRINKSIGINQAVRIVVKYTNPLRVRLDPFYFTRGLRFLTSEPT
jgi:hypothetical protein